jgi:ferritin-like protein
MIDIHENWDALPEDVRDMHRALMSLKEEIEAVDWYHQRQALCKDDELRLILRHNRDEEIEHACMTLEWLRRVDTAWNEELKTYLFGSGSITEIEEAAVSAPESTADGERRGGATDLGIGDLS